MRLDFLAALHWNVWELGSCARAHRRLTLKSSRFRILRNMLLQLDSLVDEVTWNNVSDIRVQVGRLLVWSRDRSHNAWGCIDLPQLPVHFFLLFVSVFVGFALCDVLDHFFQRNSFISAQRVLSKHLGVVLPSFVSEKVLLADGLELVAQHEEVVKVQVRYAILLLIRS